MLSSQLCSVQRRNLVLFVFLLAAVHINAQILLDVVLVLHFVFLVQNPLVFDLEVEVAPDRPNRNHVSAGPNENIRM
jgi:hypothetical protein